MVHSSSAHDELARILTHRGATRIEGLLKLSQREPSFAPVWAALAEEHWKHRRNEEAMTAARRALRLDPSLHSSFSPELSRATRPMLNDLGRSPARAPAPAARGHTPAPEPATPAPEPARASRTSSRSLGLASKELQSATALVGYRRRQKLEELSQKYPGHGPTWLALAEEQFAQRNTHQAMLAVDQAVALDPRLVDSMSTDLERAWHLHRKQQREQIAIPGPAQPAHPRPASSDPHPEPPASRDEPRTPTPQPALAAQPAPAAQPAINEAQVERYEQELVNAHVQRMLGTTLTLRDREERISVLENLLEMAPEHPDVLFNLAKELALAERGERARDVGNSLQRVSPDRYAELFAWAEERWSNAKSPSPLTRVLSALGSEPTASGAVEDHVPDQQPAPGRRRLSSASGEIEALPSVGDDEPTNIISRPPEPPPSQPDEEATVKANLDDFGSPPPMPAMDTDNETTVKASLDELRAGSDKDGKTLRMQNAEAQEASDQGSDSELKDKAIKFFRASTFDDEPARAPAPAAQKTPKRKYALNKHVIRKPRDQREPRDQRPAGTPAPTPRKPDGSR